MYSRLLTSLRRVIRGRSQLHTGYAAGDLPAGHALPRLRIFVYFGLDFVRSVRDRRRRAAHLLAKGKDHGHGPAGDTGPSLSSPVRQRSPARFQPFVFNVAGKFGCDDVEFSPMHVTVIIEASAMCVCVCVRAQVFDKRQI